MLACQERDVILTKKGGEDNSNATKTKKHYVPQPKCVSEADVSKYQTRMFKLR